MTRLRYIADVDPPVPELARLVGQPVSFLPLDKVWADSRFDATTTATFDGTTASYNAVAEGDLLVPKVAPTFSHGRIALAAGLVNGCALATSEVFVVRPREARLARWLQYRLRAADFRRQGEANQQGVAGLKRISSSFLKDVELSIPADPEGVADALDVQVEKLDRLRKRIRMLQDRAFAPVLTTVEHEFGAHPHGRIGYRYEVQLGKKLYEDRVDRATALPYLRNANVYWDRLDLSDVKVMNFEGAEAAKYALRPGDLLVCEARHLGRSAVWTGEIEPCFYQMALHRVRPYADDSTRWLMWCLRILNKRDAWAGDDANIPHLPAEKFKATRVPLPSPAEQRRLVAEFDGQADRVRRTSEILDRLDATVVEYRDALITSVVTCESEIDGDAGQRAIQYADRVLQGVVA